MRYLVRMEFVEPGPLLPREGVAAMIEHQVLPSLETLAQWEKDGRIQGGLHLGARTATYVMDANSPQELDATLRRLPFWGLMRFEVTPLTPMGDRVPLDRETLQQLRG